MTQPIVTKATLDSVAQRDTGPDGLAIARGIALYCPLASINTPLRLAHFIAQACEETEGFKFLHEIWGPTPAQKGYEGRADLGNVKSGDGSLYRGRGIFDLTGRANYTRVGAALNLPLSIQPELAADPQIAVQIACNYWTTHNINAAADADDVRHVTRLINGGYNGLASRMSYLERAKEALL